MYRMLIVDDEPIIADKLCEKLSRVTHLELDIYKAYSGIKALEWLNRTKVDIVLSDISMPGMTGMELLDRIHASWPRCKVIFLTGYSEFEYVRSAINKGVVSYILKTQGDDELLAAIDKAISEIEYEIRDEQLLQNAREQLQAVLPIIQQEYLQCLLQGVRPLLSARVRRFEEVGIPLEPKQPVYMVMGKVDRWQQELDISDRTQLLYEVRSIVHQYLSVHAEMAAVIMEYSRIVFLLQPKGMRNPTDRLEIFIKETLESVQATCRELLKVSVSFVIGSEPVYWEKINEKYARLKQVFNLELGTGYELLLTDASTYGIGIGILSDEAEQKKLQMNSIKKGMLELYLENGQKEEYDNTFYSIVQIKNGMKDQAILREVYYSISLSLLSHINRWNLIPEVSKTVSLEKLMNLEIHEAWDEAVHYLQTVSSAIFTVKEKGREKRGRSFIDNIQQYIDQHLHEDISLVKLSEQVHINPSYLSRVYKQETGKNLSDYINEIRLQKARELLAESRMKIREVGTVVGFESPAYFTHVFKRENGMTPQEYRDSHSKGI